MIMKITLLADDKVIFSKELTGVTNDSKPALAAEFAKYRGTKEYEGIVADIQKWYYGSLVKASWCATSLSYFANILGCLDRIGGKAENVNQMRLNCKKAASEGKGQYFEGKDIPIKIQKNDILFWLWKGGEMKNDSSKHVGVAEFDSSNEIIYCIGGNQADQVCTKAYDRSFLYAIYRL